MEVHEYMACAVPLIVADNRGTREYMIDRENGWVCNADSANEFAEAITFLYENPSERQRLAQRAISTVKKFSLQQTEKRMRQIYENLPVADQSIVESSESLPMISVIMGVYNQQDIDAFEKSVQSVLAQTYKNFEFIIYND